VNLIHVRSGLLRRGERVLLTQCRYPGQDEPLWTLPGGRQEPDETIAATVVREFWEETSLRVELGPLAYVSESLDAALGIHVVNVTFHVGEVGGPAEPRAQDPAVVRVEFVPVAQAPALLRADVLRIPVEAALAGARERYFAFRAEDIVEPFFRTASGRVNSTAP
jgi:ADP-ribose pyrophosphatase YjhB (NUDIX family)